MEEQFKYNKENIEEVETPVPGTKIEAVVLDIQSGLLRDFLTPEGLVNWKGCNGAEKAINVTCVNHTEGFKRSKVLRFPEDGKAHPSSGFGIWKNVYGDYPHTQQKVYLIADAKGYYQFVKQ
jgi:hypothetical protein